MKKYNLSEIMKTAHNLYKTGKYTWAESLKKSWKMAKFRISTRIGALQIKQEMEADGKSSVSCPLKPSDSAPLKHSTMPP